MDLDLLYYFYIIVLLKSQKCHYSIRYSKILAIVWNGTYINIIELYKFKGIKTYFKLHYV